VKIGPRNYKNCYHTPMTKYGIHRNQAVNTMLLNNAVA
jgi:hypothetical protein